MIMKSPFEKDKRDRDRRSSKKRSRQGGKGGEEKRYLRMTTSKSQGSDNLNIIIGIQ